MSSIHIQDHDPDGNHTPAGSQDEAHDESETQPKGAKPKLVYVWRRVVRTCLLMGFNHYTNTNCDHRINWIATELERQEKYFAIDLVTWTATETEVHIILRTRPDRVITWDDVEVASRWARLCPARKHADGTPREPTEQELIAIIGNNERIREIRRRICDSSWWMRLMCQRIAQWGNQEERESGNFWETPRPTVELKDVASLKACDRLFDIGVLLRALRETPGLFPPPHLRRSRQRTSVKAWRHLRSSNHHSSERRGDQP